MIIYNNMINQLQSLAGIKENELMASHTTFKIGGPARYFAEAKSEEEIIEACGFAKKNNLPVFVLAGGSNVLFSDRGFGGLVVKVLNSKFLIHNSEFIVGAGVQLSKAVDEAAKNNLSGLEWAAGIPGTIGGAVCGNAGAYGKSISNSVESVKALDVSGFMFHALGKTDCGFVYRGSCFKEGDKIIFEAVLKLRSGKKEDILRAMKEVLEQRKNKIPVFPSAGSFFKNYNVCENLSVDPLIKKSPELEEKIKGGKIAAGYLIEQCGLKGKKIGGAMISSEHANFIVNTGNAKAEDVLNLARLIKNCIHKKYGVSLKEEVCLVGFE